MTRCRWHFGLLTPLIAAVTLTNCDQSKATSPVTAAPHTPLRFANAPSVPSQVRGFDFVVWQVAPPDPNDPFGSAIPLCLDSYSGNVLLVNGCLTAPSASQRWAFTDNSDGTNLMLDHRALCVDGSTPHGQLPEPHNGRPPVH